MIEETVCVPSPVIELFEITSQVIVKDGVQSPVIREVVTGSFMEETNNWVDCRFVLSSFVIFDFITLFVLFKMNCLTFKNPFFQK